MIIFAINKTRKKLALICRTDDCMISRETDFMPHPLRQHIHQKVTDFADMNILVRKNHSHRTGGSLRHRLFMPLRSMNVSYKILVSNHYTDNGRLKGKILQKAVSKEMEPLAGEYHKMIESITAKIKYNQFDGVATWVYVDEMHELWGRTGDGIDSFWRQNCSLR